MTNEEAMKIINAYGKAMEHNKSQYGDLSELPYTKDRIKEALVHGIKGGADPKVREQLKAAYLMLANWQPGLANRRAPGELTDEELKNPAKAMAAIKAAGEGFLKIPPEVAAETDLLMADLNTLEMAFRAKAAKAMAAETLAVAFLRDEPAMAPELAAKLRAKMASDVPEVFLRVQELSRQQK